MREKKELNLDQPFLGLEEVAAILSITKQRLWNWYKREFQSFPKPVSNPRMGPVWKKEDIEQWKKAHTCSTTGELLPPIDGRSRRRK